MRNENGTIIGKVQYKNGEKHGKWFIWYDNGNPAYRFYYRKNTKVGVWKFYNEAGELIGTKDYGDRLLLNKNNAILFDTQSMSDISFEILRRIKKNKLAAVGLEYQTYFQDYELYDRTNSIPKIF